MKADAYAYASERLHSPEIEKLRQIERFGLEAVTGRRVLYFKEYNRLIAADNIVVAYQSSKKSQDWVEWCESNPYAAQILNEAIKIHAARSI